MDQGNPSDTFSREFREEMYSRSDALSLKLGEDKFLEVIGRRIDNAVHFFPEYS